MDMFDKISVPTDDQMEPGVLLEESWFFGNLLDRKSRMLRCYSDPCPNYKNTQDFSAGKSMEETFSSLQRLPQGEKLNLDSRKSKPRLLQRASSEKCSSMQRAPSLPVFIDYKEEPHDEESDFSMGKLIRQASINQVKVLPPKHNNTSHVNSSSSLQRAPSLPVFQESTEQIHDVESDFSMGKLIRQASLNHSKVSSTQKHTSQSISNLQRAPNSLPVSEESDFSMGKLIRQASINKVKVSPQKHTSQQGSSSSLQRAPSLPVYAKGEGVHHEEENEFSMGKLIRQASLNHAKVLPPKHNSKGLTRSPSISSITKHHIRRKQVQESMTRNFSNGLEVEDLQGFKNLDLNNENKESSPKFANTTPALLKDKNKKKPVGLSELDKIRRPPYSSEDHMKEQIKYWARAVASNVR